MEDHECSRQLGDERTFGDPEYVNNGFAWREHFNEQPPAVPTKDNHVGSYRRIIDIPANWDGKQVVAHFGSVTSQTSISM